MAYINISLADLMTIDGFPEAYGEKNKDALEAILYGCGVEVSKDYEWHYCQHRRINNEIVTCDRLEGHERFDREWLDSGYSSYDARIDSYKDIDFRVELRNMMHIHCVDMAFNENED